MTNTIHTIVIGVGAKTNIGNIMENMMSKLKNNVENNQGDFIQFITETTKMKAQEETRKFKFKGDLENGVASRYFKENKYGEVFIKSDQQQKAIMNEFGQIPPRMIPNVGKVKEWSQQKAPNLANSKFIPVGFSGGGSHVIAPNPLNRFWGITQMRVEKEIPNLFERYIERMIEES